MRYVIFAVFLVAWIGLLAVVWQNRGKLPGQKNLGEILLPVGFTVFVWMYIFALVIFYT